MKNFFSHSFFLLLFLFAGSCGKHKTEKQQYEQAHSSIKYKTYKAVSEKMEIVSANGVRKENELFMRLLLAYNWAITGQDVFAFAESDLVSGRSNIPSEKVLAHAINSIVMYQNGWNKLVKEESAEVQEAIHKNPGEDTIRFHQAVFHLVMGALAVHQENFAAARFHYTAFGEATHIYWPAQLADALGDFQKGDEQMGIDKIKEMTQNNAIPAEMRLILAENLGKAETKKDKIETEQIWPRTVSVFLLGQLKKSEIEEIHMAGIRFEKLRQKLMI
ncbi:MAG TPA: hypothetical protein VNB90_09975 [Cytophagaceae bacterium]|nr:hypothetical protein [Cytophagaceae bacterium]